VPRAPPVAPWSCASIGLELLGRPLPQPTIRDRLSSAGTSKREGSKVLGIRDSSGCKAARFCHPARAVHMRTVLHVSSLISLLPSLKSRARESPVMTTPSDARGRPPQEEQRPDAGLRRARTTRDAWLRRVSRLTGWTVAGTIALTGALSEVAAHALPGHHKQVARSSTSQSQPSDRTASATPSSPTSGSDSSSGAPDLQPPAEAPVPSDAAGGAVSGGS
jgi:hypothetical protein